MSSTAIFCQAARDAVYGTLGLPFMRAATDPKVAEVLDQSPWRPASQLVLPPRRAATLSVDTARRPSRGGNNAGLTAAETSSRRRDAIYFLSTFLPSNGPQMRQLNRV